MGATFTQTNVNAVSSLSDCVVDSSSYKLSYDTISAVTLDSKGALNIATTAALSSTAFKFSVTAPFWKVTSSAFSVVIFDCLPLTSVTNITAVH